MEALQRLIPRGIAGSSIDAAYDPPWNRQAIGASNAVYTLTTSNTEPAMSYNASAVLK